MASPEAIDILHKMLQAPELRPETISEAAAPLRAALSAAMARAQALEDECYETSDKADRRQGVGMAAKRMDGLQREARAVKRRVQKFVEDLDKCEQTLTTIRAGIEEADS